MSANQPSDESLSSADASDDAAQLGRWDTFSFDSSRVVDGPHWWSSSTSVAFNEPVLLALDSNHLAVYRNSGMTHSPETGDILLTSIPIDTIFGIHDLSDLYEEEPRDPRSVDGIQIHRIEIGEDGVGTLLPVVRLLTSSRRDKHALLALLNRLVFGTNDVLTPLREKRRTLVVVNPFCGTRKGRQLFHSKIQPVLDVANLKYDVVFTERPLHATEIARTLDVETYTDCCLCGGDGTVYEFVQGLFEHPRLSVEELRKVPICHVPIGTGNGISDEFGTTDPVVGAFICARGKVAPLDVTMMMSGGIRRFSVLHTSYAVVADVNEYSQRLRWMGPIRDLLTAVFCLLRKRFYNARVVFVPADVDENEAEGEEDEDIVVEDVQPTERSIFAMLENDDRVVICGSEEEKSHARFAVCEEHLSSHLNHALRTDEEDEPEQEEEEEVSAICKTLDANFFLLSFVNLRKFNADFWACPNNRPNSGCMEMVYMNDPEQTRGALLGALQKMLAPEPQELLDHIRDGHMITRKIKAFAFQPETTDEGNFEIDGDMIHPWEGCVGETLPSVLSILRL